MIVHLLVLDVFARKLLGLKTTLWNMFCWVKIVSLKISCRHSGAIEYFASANCLTSPAVFLVKIIEESKTAGIFNLTFQQEFKLRQEARYFDQP